MICALFIGLLPVNNRERVCVREREKDALIDKLIWEIEPSGLQQYIKIQQAAFKPKSNIKPKALPLSTALYLLL